MRCLLAVDLGLKTGLALYGSDGKLIWFRSHNFGTTERLRRGVHGILSSIPELGSIVIEGGGNLATVWEREAERRHIQLLRVDAAVWREVFLLQREQRTGVDAKDSAGKIARKVIEWSGIALPKTLRHDTAEAILIGLWGILHFKCIEDMPRELQR
jgi:hypothetical protein